MSLAKSKIRELEPALPSRRRKLGDPLFVVPVIVTVVIWEALTSWTNTLSPLFLPPFSAVLSATYTSLVDGVLVLHIYSSLYRIIASFLLSTALGIGVGWLIGWYRMVGRLTYPLVYILYPLPKIAFIGVFMVWLGLGDATNIVQATFGATFAVLINTIVGVQALDPLLLQVAKDYGAKDRQIAMKVAFPGALPIIFAGIKLGLGVAFIVTISSELIIHPTRFGLGVMISEAAFTLDTVTVFSAILALAGLAIVIFRVVEQTEKILIPWRREKT
jgi:NitT/TauT family transport system permease protein